MGILGWILFGLLAGAVARALTPGRHGIGCFGTLAVGVVGALLGGFLVRLVTGQRVSFDWDLRSFVVAVMGAVILLGITGMFGRRAC